MYTDCCSVPVSDGSIVENCTGSLIIQVLNDSDVVRADVIFPHGCPQCSMPYLVKGSLEIHRHVEKVLLTLQVSLTDDSQVEYLFCGALPCPESSLFLGDDLFSLRL